MLKVWNAVFEVGLPLLKITLTLFVWLKNLWHLLHLFLKLFFLFPQFVSNERYIAEYHLLLQEYELLDQIIHTSTPLRYLVKRAIFKEFSLIFSRLLERNALFDLLWRSISNTDKTEALRLPKLDLFY